MAVLIAGEHRHGDAGAPRDLLQSKVEVEPEAPESLADLAGYLAQVRGGGAQLGPR